MMVDPRDVFFLIFLKIHICDLLQKPSKIKNHRGKALDCSQKHKTVALIGRASKSERRLLTSIHLPLLPTCVMIASP